MTKDRERYSEICKIQIYAYSVFLAEVFEGKVDVTIGICVEAEW